MTKQRSTPSTKTSKPANEPQSAPSANEANEATPPPKQMGEGSYEATRDYQKNIGEYLRNADVDADAKAAKPRSAEEAREMKQAEEEGRSHSKAGTRTAPRT